MKLSNLKLNPTNPRVIKDDKFKKLVQSLKDFPEMMEKRPMVCVTDIDGKIFPIGGNMRLKALRELGMKEIPELNINIQLKNLLNYHQRLCKIAQKKEI